MTDDRKAPDAAQHISAASEERFIASTEEFASESSKATVLATNVIQALLVACVVLWVLDVPRQVLNVSFYTEQLLAVTLGLTLALAFIAETSRQPSAVDLGGAVRGGRDRRSTSSTATTRGATSPGRWSPRWPRRWPGPSPPAGPRMRAGSTGSAPSFRCCSRGYITVRYEALTYELAMLPVEGVIGSAILTFLVLDASRRISGWGFVAIILAIAVYVYVSPFLARRFPDPLGLARTHGRLRRPRRERHDRLDPRRSPCWW